jgi:hypothetical protein
VPEEPTKKKPSGEEANGKADDFEQRFLEFAYTTDYLIHAPTVAFALKISIDEASQKLEDLAARDVLVREVDNRGGVYYQLPGRKSHGRAGSTAAALVTIQDDPAAELMPLEYANTTPVVTAAAEPRAVLGLAVNAFCPGLGSIIGGRSRAGLAQLALTWGGLALVVTAFFHFSALLLVIGLPMAVVAYYWAIATGVQMMGSRGKR